VKPRLVVVGGWAFSVEALDPVRAAAGDACDVEVLPWYADADDVRAAVGRARVPVLLAGWSLGASKALDAAATGGLPVAGLVLVSASPRFCRGDRFIHGSDDAVVRAMALGLRRDPVSVFRRFQADCAAPLAPLVPFSPSAIREDSTRLAVGLDYLRRTDLRDACRGLRIPCRVLHGREDRIIPWEAGAWIGAVVEGATISLIDGLGHDLLLRRPWIVRDAVRDILERS
jgi:pimeloyl-[acyl-carrier protein] methyl ester esterase